MKKIILPLLIVSSSLYAQQGTGPFRRQSGANIAQKIIHVIDNSTVGSVQTVVGAAHILVFAALYPVPGARDFGISPGLHGYSNPNSEVSQIRIGSEIPWCGCAYSLGDFQVNPDEGVQAHEGGHSVQSAALGPLYLPTVAWTYLTEGYDSGTMEEWADLEADATPFMDTANAKVGMGQAVIDGKQANVVVFQFSLEQRQVMGNDDQIKSDKIFQWVNTKIVRPLASKNNPNSMPTIVEFDLLKKTLNVTSSNIMIDLGGDQSLKTSMQTEQRYIHIENEPSLNRLHIKALDWAAQYGIKYTIGQPGHNFSITPLVGVGLSLDNMRPNSPDPIQQLGSKPTWTGSYSLQASLDIRVLDYVDIRGQYKKEYYFNGERRKILSASVGNELRDPFSRAGFIQSLNFSAGVQERTTTINNKDYNDEFWNVSVGLKF